MSNKIMNFIYDSISDNIENLPCDGEDICSINLLDNGKMVIITEYTEITIEITDVVFR